jgi:hypothetical protein
MQMGFKRLLASLHNIIANIYCFFSKFMLRLVYNINFCFIFVKN